MKLLLTGSPGVGKTTLVQHLVNDVKDLKVAGFITQELREGGKRVGFDLISLDSGEKTALARIDTKERGPKVGQYTVCVGQFEKVFGSEWLGLRGEMGQVLVVTQNKQKKQRTSRNKVLALKSLSSSALTGCDIVVIDEVGKMENFSTRLIRRVREIFSEDRRIIATVPLPGRGKVLPIVQELCDRTDIELKEVTRDNRDKLREELGLKLKS